MKYIKRLDTKKYKNQTKHYALYKCECGKEKRIREDHVRTGRTISCGCKAKDNSKTHGLTKTKVYRTWLNLKNRYNPENPKTFCYKDVTICDRWSKFENFLLDMGFPTTEKHTLDRIDPYGNYNKKNCRWATVNQQMMNQKRNYKFYKIYKNGNPKVSYRMFRNRVKTQGWSIHRALKTEKQLNQYG